jgi:hypothetical protein
VSRTIRLPAIDWGEIKGVAAVFPVIVGWPELQLTPDQHLANAIAALDGQPEPYPDPSIINVEVPRPFPPNA